MSNNIFSENFDSGDFDDLYRRFSEREARKEATKISSDQKQLRNEASAYVGLAIVWFLFVTIPLALLFAGVAVVPATEAIFNAEIGFWTAFLLLLTLRWLIPRPRKSVLIRGGR